MGTHQLSKGQHKLTIEIFGANPNAEEKYVFALDYLRLEEIK